MIGSDIGAYQTDCRLIAPLSVCVWYVYVNVIDSMSWMSHDHRLPNWKTIGLPFMGGMNANGPL